MARLNLTADPRLDLYNRIWASIDAGFGDLVVFIQGGARRATGQLSVASECRAGARY